MIENNNLLINPQELDLFYIKCLTEREVNLLKNYGINNIVTLGCQTVHQLAKLGFRDEMARKILEDTWKYAKELNISSFGFINGVNILERSNIIQTLTTGCPSLDEILEGRFRTQTLVDIYGMETAGKTILLHQLACRSMLPQERGGLNSLAVIYIDCGGGFSIRLMQRIAQFQGLDPFESIKKICLISPTTTDVLLYFLERCLSKVLELTGAKLIILDSLSTPFLSEYGDDRPLMREMQIKVYKVMRVLTTTTLNYNVLTLMTNHVCNNYNITLYGRRYVHALKEHVKYESPVIIYMGTERDNKKIIKIEKAPDLPNTECYLEVTRCGFQEIHKPRKKHEESSDLEE